MAEKVNSVQAICKFFNIDSKDAMKEMKPFTTEERKELGQKCAQALGLELSA